MNFISFQYFNSYILKGRKWPHQYNPSQNHNSHLYVEITSRRGTVEKHSPYTFCPPARTSSQPLSSIRLGNRFSVWRDVFTATVSSLQASRTFNKIACEDSGREMMETPVDAACQCGLATSISNAKGFDPGLVI